MKRVFHGLDKALAVWCQAITGMLAAAVILSVFLRYVLGITFVWAEEVITMLFIATTFFGAGLAVRENEHISIEFLTTMLPGWGRKTIGVFGYMVTIAVSSILFMYSLRWIDKAGDLVTPGLRIPERYFYYMVPTCAVLIVYYSLMKLFVLIFGKQHPSQDTDRV